MFSQQEGDNEKNWCLRNNGSNDGGGDFTFIAVLHRAYDGVWTDKFESPLVKVPSYCIGWDHEKRTVLRGGVRCLVQRWRDAITMIGNPKVEQAMMALVDAAGDDIGKVRENIEVWYDTVMDRVTGWYKRRTQVILLLLGLAVAIVVNADTVTIAKSLSHDQALRSSLVAAAQEYAKSQPQGTADSSEKPEKRVRNNLEEIKKLGLPVGWNKEDPRTWPENSNGWIAKVLGWLLTAIAISLGAPFWFDLLNKFMVARSSLKSR